MDPSGNSDKLENDSLDQQMEGAVDDRFDLNVLEKIKDFLDELNFHDVLTHVLSFFKPFFDRFRNFLNGFEKVESDASTEVESDFVSKIWKKIQSSFEHSLQDSVVKGDMEKAGEVGKAFGLLTQEFDRQLGDVVQERPDLSSVLNYPSTSAQLKLAPLAAVGAALEAESIEQSSSEGQIAERLSDQPSEDGDPGIFEKMFPQGFEIPDFLKNFTSHPWKAFSEKLNEIIGRHDKTEVIALASAAGILGKEVYDAFFEEEDKDQTFLDRMKDTLWSITKWGALGGALFFSRGIWLSPLANLVKSGLSFFGLEGISGGLGNIISRSGEYAKKTIFEITSGENPIGKTVYRFVTDPSSIFKNEIYEKSDVK